MNRIVSGTGEALERRPARKVFGIGENQWKRFKKVAPSYLFILPHLVFFATFVLIPVVFGVYMSFHQWDILRPEKPFVGLDNYRELWDDELWWLTLKQTIEFALITVTLNTVVSLAAALLVKQPLVGRTFYRMIFYAPVILSVAVMGIMWQWLLNSQYGVINYLLSLIGLPPIRWLREPKLIIPSMSLATVWWTFGFPMLIFLAGLMDIPTHLYDAAKVDGANAWQSFWKITLPLLRPSMLFVLVTQFIAHFQVFGQPYVMIGVGTQFTTASGYYHWTVLVYLFETAWRWYRMGYGSTIAVGLASVILIITIIQFRLLGRRLQY